MLEQSEIWVPAVAAFLAAILGAFTAWLLGHISLLEIWRLVGSVRPLVWLKSKWRQRRTSRIPLRADPIIGKDSGMRQFEVKEINAVDGKGKTIAGTIEPVHSGYWLDALFPPE